MRFSGAQYLVIPDAASLKPEAITVFAVVKQTNATANQTLLSRGYRNATNWTSPFASYSFRTMGASGSVFLNGRITTGGSPKDLVPTNQYSLSNVHVVGWKYDGSTQKVYRGGHEIGSMTTSGNVDYGGGASTITIGSRSSFSLGEYLNADVAEILVYGRALTQGEQQQVEDFLTTKYGLENYDADSDGMPDGYELDNGLDPLFDEALLDKDGDGVPNLWEYGKDTAANDAEDWEADWIVDPLHAQDSPSDNVVGTIAAATGAVPDDNGNVAASYKTILVKKGEYPEKVVIGSNKRIALVGERGIEPVRLVGAAVNQVVVEISGVSVVDGFWVTRPTGAIAAGTVTEGGILISGGKWCRVVNCILSDQSNGGGVYCHDTGYAVVEHCTVINNKPYGMGTRYGSHMKIISSIVWNPQATGAEIAKYWSGANPEVISSIVRGGLYGGINADPLLTTKGFLRMDSPAIDAGTNASSLVVDIQGEVRPAGGARDMGADEWADSDDDDIADIWEMKWFGNFDETKMGDPDGDRLPNYLEFNFDFNPMDVDTNNNEEDDFYDALLLTLHVDYPAAWVLDTDGDGLTDGWELYWNTSSTLVDTNGDGVSDYQAIQNGIDPLSLDTDGDGLNNDVELAMGTNPLEKDSDRDGVNDNLDWYPNDPDLSGAPEGNPLDTTGPVLTLFHPEGAVIVP